jgi:hypothetical protein
VIAVPPKAPDEGEDRMLDRIIEAMESMPIPEGGLPGRVTPREPSGSDK